MKKKYLWIVVAVVAALLISTWLALPAEAKKKNKEKGYMGRGAGIGALLGLALGGGIADVAAGAALGAAGGGIANMATEEKRKGGADAEQAEAEQQLEQAQQERQLAEQERLLAERERQLMELQADMVKLREAAEETEADVIEAIGTDNWEGYKALRGCQFERANALAQAGALSTNSTHQLASAWLQAMTAVDQKDSAQAKEFYEKLAQDDPEIDTTQQASLAVDQAVLAMRSERVDIGIACR